jgi:hypothetical protein
MQECNIDDIYLLAISPPRPPDNAWVRRRAR